MIWFLSDMIMERVIRDAPVKVASSTSAGKPARWCFMPQAWAVNIHPPAFVLRSKPRLEDIFT